MESFLLLRITAFLCTISFDIIWLLISHGFLSNIKGVFTPVHPVAKARSEKRVRPPRSQETSQKISYDPEGTIS